MEFPIPRTIIPVVKDEAVSESESESEPESEPSSSLSRTERRRIAQNARRRSRRATETPEEREQRLHKERIGKRRAYNLRNADKSRQERERYKRKMEQETPEEREERLKKLREQYKLRMAKEGSGDRAKRLEKAKEQYRRRVAKEASGELDRSQRLEKLREKYRRQIADETSGVLDRAERLQKAREQYRRKMAKEASGELDREQRLKRIREKYKHRMEKEASAGVRGRTLNEEDEYDEVDDEQCTQSVMLDEIKRQEEEERLKVERDVRLLRMKCETEEQRRERRRKVINVRRRRDRRNYGTEKPLGWIGLKDPVPESLQKDGQPNPRFECPVCKTLVKENQMDNHLLTHPDATSVSFKCTLCPYACSTVSELKLHRTRHYNISPLEDHDFYCEICSTILYNRVRYVTHLRHHIRKTGLNLSENEPIYFYICDFDNCQLCFRDKPRFITHLESHSDERVSFNCPVCHKPFSKQSHCQAHVELAHATDLNNIIDCPYCHQVILNKEEDWEYHLWTHQLILNDEPQGNHLCENCGKTFRTSDLLIKHVKRHERAPQVDATPRHKRKGINNNYRSLPCTVCDEILCGKTALTSHMLRNHTYEHGVVCYLCDKRFKYLYFLTAHIRKHNNQPNITRRAKCHFCEKDFSCYLLKDKHHFYEHREEYLKTRSYCCTTCYRNFGSLELLKSHIPRHDKCRCPICGLCSVSKHSHELHLRSHNVGPLAGTRKQKFSEKYAKDNGKKAYSEFYEAQCKERELLGDLPDKYFFQNGVGYIRITDLLEYSSSVTQAQHEAPVNFYHITNSKELNVIESSTVKSSWAEDFNQNEFNEGETTAEASSLFTREKKYLCNRCQLQFQFPRPLLTHVSWHISEETMNVEPVNSVLDSALPVEELSKELEKFLNPNYVPEAEPTTTKPHVCPECSQSFLYYSNLSAHRRVKHGFYKKPEVEKRLKCYYCVRCFSNQYFFNLHIEKEHQSECEFTNEDAVKTVEVEPDTSKSKPEASPKKIKPGPRKREIPKKPVKKNSHLEVRPVARTNPRGDRTTFRCDKCHYTSTRETALLRHKQVTHENPEEADEDEENSHRVLPEVKDEPVFTDDVDWEPTTHQDDMFSDPIFSAEVCYQDDPVIKHECEQAPSITALRSRVAQSWNNLSPHLQAQAESLPFSYIKLNRVELPGQPASTVGSRNRTTTVTKSATKRKTSHKRKISQLSRDKKSKKRRRTASESSTGTEAELSDSNENKVTDASLNPWACDQAECTSTFEDKFKFRRHLRVKHGIYERTPTGKLRAQLPNPKLFQESEYYCDLCYRSLKYKGKYDRHLRSHMDVDPTLSGVIYTYQCDECPAAYRLKEMFLRHLETHGANGLNLAAVCSVCSKTFAKLDTLELHMKKVHEAEGTVYDCQYCHYSYSTEELLALHKRSHQIDLSVELERKNMCAHCGKRFKNLGNLNGHIQRYHNGEGIDPRAKPVMILRKSEGGKVQNNNRVPCQVCNQPIRDKFLHNHMLMEHTYPHGVYCFVCGSKYHKLGSLNKHISELHGEYLNEYGSDTANDPTMAISSWSNKSSLSKNCSWCNAKFKGGHGPLQLHKHQFEKHPELYLKEKPFYCKICYKNFATEDELNNGHSHNRSSVKAVRQRVRIYNHKVLQKKHKCTLCDESFTKNAYLKVHMLKHGGERNHQCTMCEKKFTTIFNLRDHERRHLKNFTCYCPHCPENTVGYYKRVHLDQHIAKFHGGFGFNVGTEDIANSSSSNSKRSGLNRVKVGPRPSRINVRHNTGQAEAQKVATVAGTNSGFFFQQNPVSVLQPQHFVLEEHCVSVPQEELNYITQFQMPMEPLLHYGPSDSDEL